MRRLLCYEDIRALRTHRLHLSLNRAVCAGCEALPRRGWLVV